ncbi:MAG TPA: hypothetical protein VJ732_07930 [Bryobacteraceae bacterium]|nr:hypothetical protein [Bryobacteraceae bacterium]
MSDNPYEEVPYPTVARRLPLPPKSAAYRRKIDYINAGGKELRPAGKVRAQFHTWREVTPIA